MRVNRAVMVRVSATDRARLSRLADRWGCSQGEAVSRLLDAEDPEGAIERLRAAVALDGERRSRLLDLLEEARRIVSDDSPA